MTESNFDKTVTSASAASLRFIQNISAGAEERVTPPAGSPFAQPPEWPVAIPQTDELGLGGGTPWFVGVTIGVIGTLLVVWAASQR